MRRYLTELIGTFFLVFVICSAVASGSALAPLAIGGALAAVVFAGGHVSGAHYNPAVTVAVFLRGRLAATEVAPYVAAQVCGALAGAGAGRLVVGAPTQPALDVSGSALVAALVAEVVVTFVLAYVVLNVATAKAHPENSFYGLAIGLTVLAGAVAVGGVSGGVFNPAVAVGVSAQGLISWSLVGAYAAVQLLAGALAAGAFRVLNPSDLEPVPPQAEELSALGTATEPAV